MKWSPIENKKNVSKCAHARPDWAIAHQIKQPRHCRGCFISVSSHGCDAASTTPASYPSHGLAALSAQCQPDPYAKHQGASDPVHQVDVAALGEEVTQGAATAGVEQQARELYEQDQGH